MAVELDGTVRMQGDTGPGVAVHILARNGRLRLVSGTEVVGEWQVSDIGVQALQDGFNIKAEGEEFILATTDDVALASEIGISAASPRLARRIAARNNPAEPEPTTEDPPVVSSRLGAIGLALGGALVVAGGLFLNSASGSNSLRSTEDAGGFRFWLAFVVGGVLMIAVAYIMSIGVRFARLVATVLLAGLIVAFGFAVARGDVDTGELTAYGFIAGGVVVAVAVLFSGSLRQIDER